MRRLIPYGLTVALVASIFIGTIASAAPAHQTAAASNKTQATMAATMTAAPATMAATMAAATPTPEILIQSTYKVELFASSTADYFGPDSLVVDGGNVFIDYQNKTAKDCTDKNTSTIVEYSMDGKVVTTFAIPGHSDGMRMDPTTKLLWVTSCEDGNPKFVTVDPKSGTITPYVFPAAPHSGGYDDLYFLDGKAYIAASAPKLDSNGNNVFPAVDLITLANGKVVLTPILKGNAKATDNTTDPATKVTLNLTDPDSLTTDDKGNLVLVSQGDSELITIANPGTPKQTVTRLPVGTQLDDTVWATSAKGSLLVSDGKTGNTYWVKSNNFVVGGIYTETPDDSGVVGMLGMVDPATGLITPFAIGFGKPTGMLFVPAS
jgi:sugar lactone lactonase YvrE